jgi:hypothetical protein
MVVCLTVTLMLGGCSTARNFFGMDAQAWTPSASPPVTGRGTPVAPAAGQILDSAPTGGRLDYQLPDGRPASFVLEAVYQSGLLVPCRVGRLGAGGGRGGGPNAYAFCRQGNQWYLMPPVIVSGF